MIYTSKDQILAFLKNFSIVRPGNYSLDDDLIEAVLNEFLLYGTDELLTNFEQVQCLLWDIKSEHKSSHHIDDLRHTANIIREDKFNLQSFFNDDDFILLYKHLRESLDG